MSPNYVIVEVSLKRCASSYIPRSHRKGCCRCFCAVHQSLMDFIWSLLFQSGLPYHDYRTALLSYLQILCNKFITLQNPTKINLPPILKMHMKQQIWLNISSNKSQSTNTNLRSATILSVPLHQVQSQHRTQTWCWGPQAAESGLLDFLKVSWTLGWSVVGFFCGMWGFFWFCCCCCWFVCFGFILFVWGGGVFVLFHFVSWFVCVLCFALF